MDAATRYVEIMQAADDYARARANMVQNMIVGGSDGKAEMDASLAAREVVACKVRDLCLDACSLMRPTLTAAQRAIVARAETDAAVEGTLDKLMPILGGD